MAALHLPAAAPPLLLRERPRPRSRLDALLECARAGDASAFHRVTQRIRPKLFNYVRGYVKGDEHTAGDVVQETFVTAWHKLDQIRDLNHLRPWLFRVARCKAITWLRRRGPKGRPMESIEFATAHGGEPAEAAEADPLRRAMTTEPGNPWRPALHAAIARLPHIYVGVVRLHYLQGLSTREVGELLELPRTTVKMRLLRARKRLKHLVLEELARRGRLPRDM